MVDNLVLVLDKLILFAEIMTFKNLSSKENLVKASRKNPSRTNRNSINQARTASNCWVEERKMKDKLELNESIFTPYKEPLFILQSDKKIGKIRRFMGAVEVKQTYFHAVHINQ